MAWNYKDNGAPKLSDDFRNNYIVNIKGKEAVTANGLVVLAHDKGIKSLKTKIIQFPNKENDMTCIVQADIIGYGWNPVTAAIVETEYSAIGDANSKNCAAMVAASYIRMAETRAVGRVLRNYTDIGMLCSDEVSSSTDEIIPMITANQITDIGAIMKRNGITADEAKAKCKDLYKKDGVRALTETEANKLIEVFKGLTAAV